jgi:hypothetical protein
MSTRIGMVKAGSVAIGDVMDGYVVTGLGRSWSLDEEESCAWGAGPWERVRVQYAYGEQAPALRVIQSESVVEKETIPSPAAAVPAAPAYGSREWKIERLADLPGLILDAQATIATFGRRGDSQSQDFTREARASLAHLTRQQQELQAELAEGV